MAAKKQNSTSSQPRVVYREFGDEDLVAEVLEDLPPQEHRLKIRATRKGKGGKTVTEITGWQVGDDTLQGLAKRLKNQCGSGGTVKENCIEIQGDHCIQVRQILSELGYI
jgi:translation initiation factor 1